MVIACNEEIFTIYPSKSTRKRCKIRESFRGVKSCTVRGLMGDKGVLIDFSPLKNPKNDARVVGNFKG